MLRVTCFGLAALLAGCASGVGEPIPYGHNTYGLNAKMGPFSGGSEAALRASIKKAQSVCQEQGLDTVVTSSGEGSHGQASIDFKCIPFKQ